MGRPERPLDPDAGPVEAFAHALRELRVQAGRPSYASLARRAHRSQTTLSEAAGGERLPTWDTTEAYVRACGADPADWRGRWEDAAGRLADHPSPEPSSAPASPPASPPPSPGLAATPEDVVTSVRRLPRVPLAMAALALVAGTAVAAVIAIRPDAGPTVTAADSAPNVPPSGASDGAAILTATPSVGDGADPKDSGCALDPGVLTLDAAEVTHQGLPAGLVQLRYSPMCGVAWPRFEPFPKADIPTGALIHVDVVRPDDNNLRSPFSARYTGAPVFGNVLFSTSRCVLAAGYIEVGETRPPESRTHCFRGRTAELGSSGPRAPAPATASALAVRLQQGHEVDGDRLSGPLTCGRTTARLLGSRCRHRRPARRLRRARRITSVIGVAVALATVPGTAEAMGGFHTSGPAVRVRAAATTQSAQVSSIPAAGTGIDIQCQVIGELVTAPGFGTSNIWDKLNGYNGGYISDLFVKETSYAKRDPRLPECQGSVAVSRESKAGAWARGQLGRSRDDWGRETSGWCARWSVGAYGRANSGYATAYVMYQSFRAQGLTRTSGTAPAGTFVFFGPARVNGNAGHVAIADGNGGMITTTGMIGSNTPIQQKPLTYAGAPYLGWSYTPAGWTR